MVESDGGGPLAVQAVIGHMESEDVGFAEVQHAPPQHQVHAIASRRGGGGVQDQGVVLKRHGAPALRDRVSRPSVKSATFAKLNAFQTHSHISLLA